MDEFDKEINKEFKRVGRIGCALAVINTLIVLAVIGAIGYVAFHFLMKVW